MKTRRLCIALAAAPLVGGWTEPPRSLQPAPTPCRVERVIDGDTLQCAGGPRVRLRGVDTAERGERGYREARDELARRVLGCTVTLIPHHRSHDRIVADVLLNGRNVGRDMDGQGWSKPSGARR